MAQALATLSIDIEARLANLEAGLDKASRIAQQNAKRIEREFDGLKAVGAGIGASIAAAFSVTAIKDFFLATVSGIDALNDLKDATGASIENISALEDIGARTGTTFESVGQTLVKFNQVLNESKAGSEQERVLKAIGLSAQELRKLDPAEALRQTAVALSKYADDGNKARIVQELFGKNVREVAPFLKDLAEAGGLNARVTTQQAEEAEKFNKQLSAAQKNVTDLARAMSGPLIASVNEFADRLKIAQARGDGFFSAALDQYKANVRKFYEDLGIIDKQNPLLSPNRVLSLPNFADLPKASAPTVPDKPKAGRRARQAFQFEDSKVVSDALAALERTDLARIESLNATLSELFNLQRETRGAPAVVEAIRATNEQLDRLRSQSFGPAITEPLEEVKQAFLRSEKDAYDEIAERIAEMDEFARQAGRNIQDALGDSVLATLDGKFDSLEQLWADTLKRMVAQGLAANLGEIVLGSFGTTGKIGGLAADLFKFIGIPGFAVGSDYVPRTGLALVHQGERIIPADQNRQGRWGGQSVQLTYAPTIQNAGSVSKGELYSALALTHDRAVAEMRLLMTRAGFRV